MKKLFLILIIACLFSCTKTETEWSKLGHINPNNCNEFIINDSMVIKPYLSGYTLFINDIRVNIQETYKSNNKTDIEMINSLQWRYENIVIYEIKEDYMIGRKTDCIEIN